jgi:hypothetical protein
LVQDLHLKLAEKKFYFFLEIRQKSFKVEKKVKEMGALHSVHGIKRGVDMLYFFIPGLE